MNRLINFLFLISLIILFVSCLGAGKCPASKNDFMDSKLHLQPVYWYERAVKEQAWMAMSEAAVFLEKGRNIKLDRDLLVQRFQPDTVITGENNFLLYLESPKSMDRELLLQRLASLVTLNSVRQASPVFYTDKKMHPATRLVLTGEIIVQFPEDFSEKRIENIEKEYGLKRLESFSFAGNTFLYEAGEPLHSLEVANDLYESGLTNYAYPNWLRSRSKRF